MKGITGAIMKILVTVLTFITLPLFAQQPPPPTPPHAPPPQNVPGPPLPPHQTPQFTELEQTIAADISAKQAKLQQEINDFIVEVREHHPGYEFFNGNLVPIQPPPKPEEKKK